MPDDCYEQDFLTWTEQQAGLLRRLEAGERVKAAIDWPHLIAEVQDLGLSELRAGESLLRQALIHLLTLHLFPEGPVAHWRSETGGFLIDAKARLTPAVRRRVDLAGIYSKASTSSGSRRPRSSRRRPAPSRWTNSWPTRPTLPPWWRDCTRHQ